MTPLRSVASLCLPTGGVSCLSGSLLASEKALYAAIYHSWWLERGHGGLSDLGTQPISRWWLSSPVLPPLATLLQLEGTAQFKSQTHSPLRHCYPTTVPGGFSAPSALGFCTPRPHPQIAPGLLQAFMASPSKVVFLRDLQRKACLVATGNT